MIALRKGPFLRKMRGRGIPSVLELARRTGLHRNTINHYLAGQSVYQDGYLTLCRHMGVSAHDLVCERPGVDIPKNVAAVMDVLAARYPKLAFVLFGSRARLDPKPFSDWDVGFFSSSGVTHDEHLGILGLVDDLCEREAFAVDAVNLNLADRDFLERNAGDFVFLTGSLTEWISFKEKVCKISNSKKP